jgi:predicted GIY-YIG superfamily endonuclease
MYYVYLLRSILNPNQTYIGSTGDLRKRLAEHNAGKSIHTNKFKPWDVVTYVALPERHLAERFERYLKSGSGRAFAKRHLEGAKLPETLKPFPEPPLLRNDGPPSVGNGNETSA